MIFVYLLELLRAYRNLYTHTTYTYKFRSAFISFYSGTAAPVIMRFFFSFLSNISVFSFFFLKSYYQMCRVRVYIFIRMYSSVQGKEN